MRSRVHGYRGRYPMWAYYGHKPDMRCRGWLQEGQEGVRLQLSVSSGRVLLSDYDAWHAVLCNRHYSRSEREWSSNVDRATDYQVRASWERVLDVRPRPYADWLGHLRVQATVEEFRLSDVLTVEHFTGRRSR